MLTAALKNLILLSEAEGLSLEQMTAIAVTLNDISRTASKALATMKERLRAEADSPSRDSSSVDFSAEPLPELLTVLSEAELEALSGRGISIHFPQPKVTLKKGVDPEELSARIGQQAFRRYFKVELVYKLQPDVLQTVCKDSTDPARAHDAQIVTEYLEDSYPTPRVRFPNPLNLAGS